MKRYFLIEAWELLGRRVWLWSLGAVCMGILSLGACGEAGYISFPENQKANCIADAMCPRGMRCIAGLCLGKQALNGESLVEGATEGILPEETSNPEETVASEGNLPDAAELPVEREPAESVENNPEIPTEAHTEAPPERELSCLAQEICADGLDNNCDGQIDEGCPACKQDKDCLLSASCVDDACVAASCQNDGDCPNNTLCRDDLCITCEAGNPQRDCPAGLLCRSDGQCLPCDKDEDCTAPQICERAICSPPQCDATRTCAPGFLCIKGRCDFCSKNEDCPSGERCLNKLCQKGECTQSSECSGGLVCKTSSCVPCTQDTDCVGNTPCLLDLGRCEIPIVSLTFTYPSVGSLADVRLWRDGSHALSCKGYRDGKSGYAKSSEDGIYLIQPTASPAPFPVYCLMSHDGGGWTLLLKANGNNKTFAYNESRWTNLDLFQPLEVNMDLKETKLLSFATLPFTEILLGMSDLTANAPRRYLKIRKTATSFLSLSTAGRNISFDTGVGRAAWQALIPSGQLHNECNREAFNVHGDRRAVINDYPGFRARLGILSSSGGGCGGPLATGPNSAIGLGIQDVWPNVTAGNAHVSGWDSGKSKKLMGYLFAR